MKSIFSILLICFISFNCYSQHELWARIGGGPEDDEAEALTIDKQGNVYVAGFFKSAEFKIGEFTFKNKGASGNSDVFVAKYDAEGKLLWAKSWGGEGEDQPLAILTDEVGNVIVRGYFDSKVFSVESTKLENPDLDFSSFFVVKIDPLGKIAWSKGGHAFPIEHQVDAAGNVFVSGDLYKGDTDFDQIKISNPEDGFFIAKITPDGKYEWVRKAIGGKLHNVNTDNEGNIIASGTIELSQLVFEGGKKLKNTQGVVMSTDFFVAKYNKAGDLKWCKAAGGAGIEEPKSQVVDKNGNVFIVVRFTSADLHMDVKHSNEGGDDLLLVKYDKDGNVKWAKSEGGPGHDKPIYLTGDNQGNVILTGHFFSSKLSFDDIVIENAGENDIFIVKYNADGKVLWAQSTGSSSHDIPVGQVIDEKGNLYMIGIFNSSLGKAKVTEEFFLFEMYDPSGKSMWKNKQHRTDNFDFSFGETLDKSGHIFLVGYFGGHFTFGSKTYSSVGKKDLFVVKYDVVK